eukprot:gene15375-biopygen15727
MAAAAEARSGAVAVSATDEKSSEPRGGGGVTQRPLVRARRRWPAFFVASATKGTRHTRRHFFGSVPARPAAQERCKWYTAVRRITGQWRARGAGYIGHLLAWVARAWRGHGAGVARACPVTPPQGGDPVVDGKC